MQQSTNNIREKRKRSEPYTTTDAQEKILTELGVEDGTRVSSVLLHQPFTIVGMTASTLYDHAGFNMLYTSKGLVVEYFDASEKKHACFIVSLSNIVVAYL